jgi:hypothetical protein
MPQLYDSRLEVDRSDFSWLVATDELAWSEELYRIFEFDREKRATLELVGARVHPKDMRLFQEHVARALSDDIF